MPTNNVIIAGSGIDQKKISGFLARAIDNTSILIVDGRDHKITESIPKPLVPPSDVYELMPDPIPYYPRIHYSPVIKNKVPGRNDLCSCGSGIKYKRCCMK